MEILSKNALKFWRENKDLKIAPSANVIFWPAESDNRLHVLLEIGENATSQEIREAVTC